MPPPCLHHGNDILQMEVREPPAWRDSLKVSYSLRQGREQHRGLPGPTAEPRALAGAGGA